MRRSRTVLICSPIAAPPHIKVLVHDGLGIWLAARRLHQGKFFWSGSRHGSPVELDTEQLRACCRIIGQSNHRIKGN
ncbi:IS66 family insertion sequence element accessory protein TnpB [Pseudomonas sp. H11T01]|uniref:IS66 family insertion sequence element accessory protein TnpB n=1 Tax=Pseudomonas sp. H11T01 TaxID=3402749 RepID=UPI003AD79F4C